MVQVEGFPRIVGPESVAFDVFVGGEVERRRVSATVPMLRKAGARIAQRTLFVINGDVLFDVKEP